MFVKMFTKFVPGIATDVKVPHTYLHKDYYNANLAAISFPYHFILAALSLFG